MNNLRGYIIALSLAITLVSCEKVVTIDLEQTEIKLTVDGLLTNQMKKHVVKLTSSIDFYGSEIPRVTNASVQVVDEVGTVYTYSHNPEAIDTLAGFYFSDIPYQGQVGQGYTLNINFNGMTFSATDTLKPVSPIDSLGIQIDQQAVDDSENDGEIYQVILYANEPQDTKDFYYFRFYRDSVLETSNNVYVFDDVAIGSLDGIPSPILFREGELAGVEIYSLTREQYVFFTDLNNILNNDGGMFSPPPANPRTNISNGALGHWQVSAVTEGEILIEL